MQVVFKAGFTVYYVHFITKWTGFPSLSSTEVYYIATHLLCSSGDQYLLDPCREEEKICRGFVSLSFFEDCKLAQFKHTGKQHCSIL